MFCLTDTFHTRISEMTAEHFSKLSLYQRRLLEIVFQFINLSRLSILINFQHSHCSFPLTRYELITVVSFKNCASKNAMCNKLICSDEKSPVCGNDGNIYTNMCHLHKATCMTGIQLAHVGECVVKSLKKTKEICPKKCDKEEKKIVCGSDGNSYQ